MKGRKLSTRELFLQMANQSLTEVLEASKTDIQAHLDTTVYTADQAPGAMSNGTIVEKINTEPGDFHKDGARARVIGSLPEVDGLRGYFVEWDDTPEVPQFVKSTRIQKAKAEGRL